MRIVWLLLPLCLATVDQLIENALRAKEIVDNAQLACEGAPVAQPKVAKNKPAKGKAKPRQVAKVADCEEEGEGTDCKKKVEELNKQIEQLKKKNNPQPKQTPPSSPPPQQAAQMTAQEQDLIKKQQLIQQQVQQIQQAVLRQQQAQQQQEAQKRLQQQLIQQQVQQIQQALQMQQRLQQSAGNPATAKQPGKNNKDMEAILNNLTLKVKHLQEEVDNLNK